MTHDGGARDRWSVCGERARVREEMVTDEAFAFAPSRSSVGTKRF